MPNEHRPRYRVQKYVIAIHSLIGVNLFRKCVEGRRVLKALEWSRGRHRREWCLGRVYTLSSGVGSGPPEKFLDFVLILSFKMLNFYVFWTPEQGDSTA